MDGKIRAFIALKLPRELTDLLGEVQAGLKKNSSREKDIIRAVSWVRPENIHLTLKFIGLIEKTMIDGITAALQDIASTQRPLKLATAGVGGFPGLKNPRVLWLGIRESAQLTGLANDIEQRLSGLGIEKENRAFTPHLTLCRIKSIVAGRALGEGVGHLGYDATMDFNVDSMVLFESVLSPAGARYEELRRIELKGAE